VAASGDAQGELLTRPLRFAGRSLKLNARTRAGGSIRVELCDEAGPGRGRKSTRPGANGVVELSPCDFLDRLADLVRPPRKHRHRPTI
jgi:hypothetical protein